MALFSRRPHRKADDPAESTDAEPTAPRTGGAAVAAPDEPTDAESRVQEEVPHVGISISTFGQGFATPAATAPPATQAVPGMPDNVLLQAALAALPEKPQGIDVMNIMRQTLQGPLYVRARGDAQSQLTVGKALSLAIATHDGKRFLLAFSGGRQMQQATAKEDAANSTAVRQAARDILRLAVESGYDGVYLDQGSVGARLVLPIPLVRKTLDDGAPPFELKQLIAGPRGDATGLEVAEVLTRVQVWVAGAADASGRMGVAQAVASDGTRRLEVFSHPIEVVAMGRGDRPLPLTPVQLGQTLASEPGLTGVIIDPAGPWIALDRDVLAPVIALAE
ncbi:MAG: SseB family protein [Microbacterium sp.]